MPQTLGGLRSVMSALSGDARPHSPFVFFSVCESIHVTFRRKKARSFHPSFHRGYLLVYQLWLLGLRGPEGGLPAERVLKPGETPGLCDGWALVPSCLVQC